MFRPEIPLKYKQVEYIQFNGSAYIDTGIPTSDNLKVVVNFNTNVTDKIMLGGRQSSSVSGLVIGLFNHYKNLYGAFGGATIKLTTSKDYCDGVNHTLILSKDIFKIDDEDVSLTRGTFTYPNNIYLGTFHNAGTVDTRMYQGKIYSFTIYDGEDIVCDLVPVKNENDVAGFYDTVKYKFMPSVTDEQFEAGNEITFDLTLADKLNYLINTKKAIRKAIIKKGIEVDDGLEFRSYVEQINKIQGIDTVNSIIERNISGEYTNNLIKNIGASSFKSCTNLEKISSTSITSIANQGLYGCTNLKEFDFPNLKKLSAGSVFQSCSSLVSAYCPNVEGTVGANSFNACTSLEKAYFKNISTIGGTNFNGDTKFSEIVINRITPPSLSNVNAFTNTPIAKYYGYIYVPRQSLETYKNATNWINFSSQIRAIEDWTIDGTLDGNLDINRLYQRGNYVDGKSINENGIMADSSISCYIEKIEIEVGKSYLVSGIPRSSTSNIRTHSYDINDNWIKQERLDTINISSNGDFILEITTSNAKYIRISMPSLTAGDNSFSIREVL